MNRLRWGLLGHGSGIALATVVLAGVTDALISCSQYVDSEFLWLSVAIWVICSLPVILFLSVLSSAVATPRRDSGWRSPARIAGIHLVAPPVLVLWLGALIWVNVNLFGTATAWPSLVADLTLTLGAAAAITALGVGSGRLFRRIGIERAIAVNLFLAGAGATLCLVGAYLWWPPAAGPADTQSTPGSGNRNNVILILIDTLRRDHLSSEGYDRPTTPAIDDIARGGVRFERCMSQSSHTKPAVASLLTSSYLSGHGAGGPRSVIAETHITLVEAFRRAGYRTGMFVANPVVAPNQGYAQGAEHFWGLQGMLSHQTILGYVLIKLLHQPLVSGAAGEVLALVESIERAMLGSSGSEVLMTSASEVAAAFLSWRDEIDGETFFAYLHFGEPHAPYRPPPETADLFFSPSEPFVPDHPARSGLLLPFSASQPLIPAARSGMIRAYDGEIAHVDAVVGDVVAKLGDMGDGQQTLVVVTSDHGEEFYDHRSWGHGQSLYHELLEIPLLMSGAGMPAGRVVSQLVELIDVAPTLLAVADLPVPETMHGRSLLPLIRGETNDDEPRQALAEVHHRSKCWARCLIQDPYKLIISHQGGSEVTELFDLVSDPDETHDLAPSEPELVVRLSRLLEMKVSAAANHLVEVGEKDLDPTTEQRLRALGYLD